MRRAGLPVPAKTDRQIKDIAAMMRSIDNQAGLKLRRQPRNYIGPIPKDCDSSPFFECADALQEWQLTAVKSW